MSDQDKIINGLQKVLAETYALYLKSQNYHWNVEGMHFASLHAFFEEQYTELAEAVDEIAETIRILGRPAPGSFKVFDSLNELSEPLEKASEKQMLEDLLSSHEQLIQHIKQTLGLARDQGEDITEGLLSGRITTHAKTAWMIKSHLNEI